MSKFALLASSMLLALATPASAEILFRGVIRITAAQNCPNGPNVGNLDHASYHPRGLGNENFAALTQIWTFGANSYRLADGKNFTASFQQVISKGIGWADYTPSKPSFVLVSSQVPKPLTLGTTSITLKGRIKNPRGNDGAETCIVDFEMVGVKEVDE